MIYYGLLLWLAVIPGVVLLRKVYNLDHVEKESKKLLKKILLYSALSIIIAIIFELIIREILGICFSKETIFYRIVDNFIGVALIEELCKYYAAKIPTWNNKEFDYRFDAIVYTVTSAIGFSVIENILYCLSGGLEVALLRAVLGIPGHVIYGIFMGYFYGKAKYAMVHNDRRGYNKNVCLAILVPVMVHGFDDFCLTEGNKYLLMVYMIYIVFLYVFAFKKQKKFAKEDSKFDDILMGRRRENMKVVLEY